MFFFLFSFSSSSSLISNLVGMKDLDDLTYEEVEALWNRYARMGLDVAPETINQEEVFSVQIVCDYCKKFHNT